MFIMNVITSGFEMIATMGDIYSMWCDYNAQSTLVEKHLSFKNIVMPSTDREWVYEDVSGDMPIEEIAAFVEGHFMKETIGNVWKNVL